MLSDWRGGARHHTPLRSSQSKIFGRFLFPRNLRVTIESHTARNQHRGEAMGHDNGEGGVQSAGRHPLASRARQRGRPCVAAPCTAADVGQRAARRAVASRSTRRCGDEAAAVCLWLLLALAQGAGQDAERLDSVYPHEVVASGGTLLTVFGSFSSVARHECRLVDTRVPANRLEVASQSGADRLICRLPRWPYPESIAAVSVVNVNESSQVGNANHVPYVNVRATITSVDPSNGDPAGGTVVTVLGAGFSPSRYDYACRFTCGNVSVMSGLQVLALFPEEVPSQSAESTSDLSTAVDTRHRHMAI